MEKIRNKFKTSFDPAIAKLIAVLLGSLLIYIFAFILPANLLKLYNRAGLDGHLLQDAGILGFVRLNLGFVGVGLLYLAGIRITRQNASRTAWITVVGGTLAFRANLTSAFFGALAAVGVERISRRLGASSFSQADAPALDELMRFATAFFAMRTGALPPLDMKVERIGSRHNRRTRRPRLTSKR